MKVPPVPPCGSPPGGASPQDRPVFFDLDLRPRRAESPQKAVRPRPLRGFFFLLPWAFILSCAAPPPPPTPVPSAPSVLTRSQVIPVLARLESSFYTHWGAVERTPEYAALGANALPALRELVHTNGDYALMALRVLARRAPEEKFSPDQKAILYATAFGRETNYARWGVLSPGGLLPGVYGDELLSLRSVAAPYLQKYLSDRRPAPLQAGKSEERTHWIQQDRVCDYAWVLLSLIFDRPLAYAPDPRNRDPQIHEFDLWLDRRR